MKVISGIGQLTRPLKNAYLAIGVFDGVHIGHQKLIQYIVDQARRNNGQAAVLTFSPHPVHVLRPDKFLPLILPLKRRLTLFQEYGVDVTLVARFTKAFARMQPEQFIKRYIVNAIGAKEVVVGSDFKFGSDRSGTLTYFQDKARQYGFKVTPLDCIQGKDAKVGSTMIRHCISDGELSKAAQLLGRPFVVEGIVRQGYHRGERLGFPTANIYPENLLLPPDGAYAVKVTVNEKTYNAMANIGYCPSFKNRTLRKSIEVHIFNFSQKIYRKHIKIEFLKYLRAERKFSSPENLITQLKRDKKSAFAYFS